MYAYMNMREKECAHIWTWGKRNVRIYEHEGKGMCAYMNMREKECTHTWTWGKRNVRIYEHEGKGMRAYMNMREKECTHIWTWGKRNERIYEHMGKGMYTKLSWENLVKREPGRLGYRWKSLLRCYKITLLLILNKFNLLRTGTSSDGFNIRFILFFLF
jgi:hypothetical protein